MSTLAIYGDGGEEVIDERHSPADGPAQMAGVATAWEEAVDGANAQRVVTLRTGIVLDNGTPAFNRLTRLTRLGLGGRIGTGEQWISRHRHRRLPQMILFLVDQRSVEGVVHVTSPNPIRNRDMMASLRSAFAPTLVAADAEVARSPRRAPDPNRPGPRPHGPAFSAWEAQ